jgi:hypothetical protein
LQLGFDDLQTELLKPIKYGPFRFRIKAIPIDYFIGIPFATTTHSISQ